MNIGLGIFCKSFTVVNLTSDAISFRQGGQRYALMDKCEQDCAVKDGSEPHLLIDGLAGLATHLDMTGSHTNVVVTRASSEEALNQFYAGQARDFLWQSGIRQPKLAELDNSFLDQETLGCCVTDRIIPTILPDTGGIVRGLDGRWPRLFDLLEATDAAQPLSIPHILHFVWLRKNLNKPISRLKPAHIARFRTWIDQHGADFEYWIWTDCTSFADLNLQETVEELQRTVPGLIIRCRFIAEAVQMATAHFEQNCALQSELSADAEAVPFSHIWQAIEPFLSCPHVGMRSDVLKFLILYLKGGVYADINDTEALRPLQPLLQPFDFIACMEPDGTINTSMAAAKPLSRVLLSYLCNLWLHHDKLIPLNRMIADNEACLAREDDDSPASRKLLNAIDFFVVQRTGPIPFTKAVFACATQDSFPERVCVLPSSYWYPGWGLMSHYAKSDWLKKTSFANHYDERAFVGVSVDSADSDLRVALGELPGASKCLGNNRL